MYKKILYVIVLSVLALSACSPTVPVNTDPGKIVFLGAYTDNLHQGLYYLDPVGGSSVQTQLQNLYTPTWTFINPNGGQIITLSFFNGQESVTTLGIIDSANPENITKLIIPKDILGPSLDVDYWFNVSFLGDKTYMEYDYEDNGRHFAVFEITGNGLKKVTESVLTGDYSTIEDNGDSPIISRVVLLPPPDEPDKHIVWLYNMRSGKIDTLAKQRGDEPQVPSWSPDGSKYIYSTYQYKDNLYCWYLVKGNTPDQKLVCLPSDWKTGTGYGGSGGFNDHAWSPDMKYVVVVMSEWANSERNIMYLINIEHKPKIVATIPINEGITGLVWSPNGKLLAYSVVNSDISAIYTLSTNGIQNELATAPNYQADDWIAPNGYPQLGVVGWLK